MMFHNGGSTGCAVGADNACQNVIAELILPARPRTLAGAGTSDQRADTAGAADTPGACGGATLCCCFAAVSN